MKIDPSVYTFLEDMNTLMRKYNIHFDVDAVHIRHSYNYVGCIRDMDQNLDLFISEDDDVPEYSTKKVIWVSSKI